MGLAFPFLLNSRINRGCARSIWPLLHGRSAKTGWTNSSNSSSNPRRSDSSNNHTGYLQNLPARDWKGALPADVSVERLRNDLLRKRRRRNGKEEQNRQCKQLRDVIRLDTIAFLLWPRMKQHGQENGLTLHGHLFFQVETHFLSFLTFSPRRHLIIIQWTGPSFRLFLRHGHILFSRFGHTPFRR